METITSSENNTIKLIRKLNTCNKARLELGQIVIEGPKLLDEALKSGLFVEACLFTSQALQKYEGLVARLEKSTRVALIDERLSTRISLDKSSYEVFSVCEMPQLISANKADLAGNGLAVIGLQDPGNLGTIIRTAEALGLFNLFVSRDSASVFSPKVIRASMGSCFRQKVFMLEDLQAFIAQCKLNGFATYAAALLDESQSICDVTFAGNSIVFIGNEGNGLPASVLSSVDACVRIPMVSAVESLNAAIAAAFFIQKLSPLCS